MLTEFVESHSFVKSVGSKYTIALYVSSALGYSAVTPYVTSGVVSSSDELLPSIVALHVVPS